LNRCTGTRSQPFLQQPARIARRCGPFRIWNIGLLLLLTVGALPAEEFLSFDAALDLAFPNRGSGGTSVRKVNPHADDDTLAAVQRASKSSARGSIGGIYLGLRDGRLVGSAVVDHVIGRTEYITWLLVLDPHGQVRNVAVMSYREPIGGEIRSERWRAQFLGKNLDDPLRLRRDISNIAGATLSCRAVTQRVRHLLHYHRLVLEPWLAAQAIEPARAEPAEGELLRSIALGDSLLRLRLRADDADELAEDAFALARTIDAVGNCWRPDSELSELVADGGGEASAELWRLLRRIAELHQLSDGIVDPTVRPLLALWAAGEATQTLPDADAIARGKRQIGFGAIALHDDQRRIEIPEGLSVDCSAVLKGHLLDRLGEAIDRQIDEDEGALLSYGDSSWLAVGSGAWALELVDPRNRERRLGTLTLAGDRAFASSGSYRRAFVIDEQRFSHLIDPHSGEPAAPDRAAFVLADNAALADALATTCCIADSAQARELVESLEAVEAWLWDGEQRWASSGWPGLDEAAE